MPFDPVVQVVANGSTRLWAKPELYSKGHEVIRLLLDTVWNPQKSWAEGLDEAYEALADDSGR